MQGRKSQRRVETLRQRIADDLATAGIQNDRQIAKSRHDTDIGKVCDPNPVRLIWNDVAVKVWEDWGIVPAVGRSDKAPAGLDAKSRHPHHPCYPFVIDHKSAATKLVGHAAVAVARQFILDVFDDCCEFGVCQPFGLGGAAFQIMLRNPLADPGLIGITAGASIGAVSAIVLGRLIAPELPALLQTALLPLAAFVGATLVMACVFTLSRRGGETSVAMLILIGIAINTIAGALIGVLVYVADDYRRYDDQGRWIDPGRSLPPLRLNIPARDYVLDASYADRQRVATFLQQPPVERLERYYTIEEVKRSSRLRDMVRRLEIGDLTFDTGSANIAPGQVDALSAVAYAMLELLERNPAETFLIEGHTDAVGSDLANLALSDRRAEAIAAALTNVFGIPPENLVTQGYGERYLKVNTQEPERENRRVAVRRITPLVAPVAGR